jgi:hypothetical protein
MKRETILDKILNQKIIIDGCIYTRGELAQEMRRDGFPTKCIDITCFYPPQASDIELEMYREQSKILKRLDKQERVKESA